jgi:tetratricopeptide (TPR) repeat protein
MSRLAIFASLLALAGASCLAQEPSSSSQSSQQSPSQESDRNREAQESSSRETRIDISPPKDDAKNHPESANAVSDLEIAPAPEGADVQEFHPWNPMKALKNVEVGDYYFKRKNYKAALDRYKEALYYKENDAIASFRLAVCQEKLGDKTEAIKYYEQYLKILPEGQYAKDAHAALAKLDKSQ